MNIFELNDEINSIAVALDRLDEIGADDEFKDVTFAYFAGLMEDRDAKVDSYAALIRKFESEATIAKAEADRVRALAQAAEGRAKRLKDRLKEFMEMSGISRFETATNKIAIQKNGGKAPLEFVDGVTADLIPEEYQKISIEFDREGIRADLESGVALDFAYIGEPGTHLRLR